MRETAWRGVARTLGSLLTSAGILAAIIATATFLMLALWSIGAFDPQREFSRPGGMGPIGLIFGVSAVFVLGARRAWRSTWTRAQR
jgi:hypothetical protein